MEFNSNTIKFFVSLIIFCLIIPKSEAVLSFTYPQMTTLYKSNNTLVVEKHGIYICDSSITTIISTLHVFSEEDKIDSLSKLSKTLITKSSYVILILSNFKIYITNSTTGELLYSSGRKLIAEEDVKYVTLPYFYKPIEKRFNFLIGYIDSINYLQIKYYQFINNTNTVIFHCGYSFNSVIKNNFYDRTFDFQNKGLSCSNVADTRNTSFAYITCFLIGESEGKDYLFPVIFDKQDVRLSLINDIYKRDYVQVNNVNQIRSDTNADLTISYVCINTDEKISSCYKFTLDKKFSESEFNLIKQFEKNCRTDIYGIKVNYLFEKKNVLFSCPDIDGSFQTYFFEEDSTYIKYQNCYSIFGYSVIYINNLNNYYVISDVNCPQGKIPFNILYETSDPDFIPELAPLDTTSKEIIVESTEKIETIKSTEIKDLNDESDDCPEMCSKCNSQKKCTKCNKIKNYYPIKLTPEINPPGILECITEDIRQYQYPNFYFDSEEETFKSCYFSCATCFGKGDQNFNNCKTCILGYIFHPDYENSKDCVLRPNNDYYYIKNGIFTLTTAKTCPDDYKFLIEEKGKCIDICKNDNKYKYSYDELCYENPPENTNDNDGDFICKDNPNIYIATRKNYIHQLIL